MSTANPIPASHDVAAPRRLGQSPIADSLLSTRQAAEYLGLKPKTLIKDRYARQIGIPFVKMGKSVRYRRADLEKLVADCVVA